MPYLTSFISCCRLFATAIVQANSLIICQQSVKAWRHCYGSGRWVFENGIDVVRRCHRPMEMVCHWLLLFFTRRFGLSLHQWYENERLFLEAWHSTLDPNAGNDHNVLPEAYKGIARAWITWSRAQASRYFTLNSVFVLSCFGQRFSFTWFSSFRHVIGFLAGRMDC